MKKKQKLDHIPKHSHLPKPVNVKLIISSRNENEPRCKIMEVTDIMYILQHALLSLKLHNGKAEKSANECMLAALVNLVHTLLG